MFMAPFALRRLGRSSAILIAVAAAGYAAMVARFIFEAAHWIEWPSVALILVFVFWIGLLSATRNPLGPWRDSRYGAPKPAV
jgi:hypothetical protein